MYVVKTYTIFAGLFGSVKIAKADEELGKFINDQAKLGLELVAMTEMNTNSIDYSYKLVFKQKAD